ncbi:MAG: Hpt domain-containing protein [Oscillospiraceae bacterium]|nr:Hpt domain-containing protein [Oscillospiraceae bacterium]MBQ9906111.1 Hpt domain-containing protein [Oscillospiraceae bacterium]MBR5364403.1 Hpt domain-containing protein [Oscillospiraceae bacterium]
MMTIDSLRAFGADVDAGLTRCLNKEDFYLMLVNKAREDQKLTELAQQLGDRNLDAAFETAHALKGMYANLSLTPLTEPVSEMTELLRKRTDTDYSALLHEAQMQFEKLCSL